MVDMKTLIRIIFVIFIANGIDCLGRVCDNCCDCFKEKDKNNTAESLVHKGWHDHKENLVLMIFVKEENGNVFTSKDNKYKISIEFDEKGNPKIAYQNESKQELKLEGKKYALFEIKTQEEENTVYLYCSDIESSENEDGIFDRKKKHVSISVIACDTEKVMNMEYMFSGCSSLTKLDLQKFNTTNVTNMECMFSKCSSLIELNLQNFNTKNVTNMEYMFEKCSSLKKLKFGKNFNTTNVTNMEGMFSWCNSLTELNLQNFNTTNVTDMEKMFYYCEKLAVLKLEENFNTENVKNMMYMFFHCSSFPEDIRNKLDNVEEVIKFFKEKDN